MSSNSPSNESTWTGYLHGRRVILGVSGSIAAYKAALLARALVARGADVTTVLTEAATRFIAPLTFEALTQNKAYTDADLWTGPGVLHVELARNADLVLIAPATQDLLARVAAGRANDLLSLVVAEFSGPVGLCPAMHTAMWESRATQDAVHRLQSFGYQVLAPDSGPLASGDEGSGRLPEMQVILDFAEGLLAPKDLAGLRVMVTAGPTREPIDPVRMLTNPSSGKMGFALAREAYLRGGSVNLILGPVHDQPPAFIEVKHVQTALDMADAVNRDIHETDVLLMCAAVVDFAPVNSTDTKIEKDGFDDVLRLKRNPDILSGVTAMEKRPFVVGFAAQTDLLLEKARKKMQKKHPDLLFANLVGRGRVFGRDVAAGLLLRPDGSHTEVTVRPKRAVARLILDEVKKGLK